LKLSMNISAIRV